MDISQQKYTRIGMCVLISLGFNYLNPISFKYPLFLKKCSLWHKTLANRVYLGSIWYHTEWLTVQRGHCFLCECKVSKYFRSQDLVRNNPKDPCSCSSLCPIVLRMTKATTQCSQVGSQLGTEHWNLPDLQPESPAGLRTHSGHLPGYNQSWSRQKRKTWWWGKCPSGQGI